MSLIHADARSAASFECLPDWRRPFTQRCQFADRGSPVKPARKCNVTLQKEKGPRVVGVADERGQRAGARREEIVGSSAYSVAAVWPIACRPASLICCSCAAVACFGPSSP